LGLDAFISFRYLATYHYCAMVRPQWLGSLEKETLM